MAPIIETRDLSRHYRMGEVDVAALRGVSLTIEAGEAVAIVGASGSGKSTLMGILGCLDWPSDGQYLFDGQEVARLTRAQLAHLRNRSIGFVFQNFNLLHRASALENVELPLIYGGMRARERRRRALEVLEAVGLGDRAHHLPTQLSGGQQQRVAVARALANRPRLLLADEPTGALDSATSASLLSLLTGINRQGLTLVLITHDPAVAAAMPRVIRLADGQIQSDDAVLLNRKNPIVAAAE